MQFLRPPSFQHCLWLPMANAVVACSNSIRFALLGCYRTSYPHDVRSEIPFFPFQVTSQPWPGFCAYHLAKLALRAENEGAT